MKDQFGSVFSDLGVVFHRFSSRNTKKRPNLVKTNDFVTCFHIIFTKIRENHGISENFRFKIYKIFPQLLWRDRPTLYILFRASNRWYDFKKKESKKNYCMDTNTVYICTFYSFQKLQIAITFQPRRVRRR